MTNDSFATSPSKNVADFDDFIEKSMQEIGIPGLAIAIVKEDSVILARGYGHRETDAHSPVDKNTLFAIASNTKAFTATGLGLLVQEGKLSWDDPVTRYLPGFQLYDPYVTREITVRDLLCHRAGLPTWGGDLLGYGSDYTTEELLHQVRYIKPAFSFRAGFGYSNLMFVAAGQILATVSKMSWADFIRESFFDPLGMTRSQTSVLDLAALDNVAQPHTVIKDKVVRLPYRDRDFMAPAGAICSSVNEMAQWLRLQLGNGVVDGQQLIETAVITETRTPHTLIPIPPSQGRVFPSVHFVACGLGWFVQDYQGRLLVSHAGGIDGMTSRLGYLPEEKLGVVILTNGDYRNYLPSRLLVKVIDHYLGLASERWIPRHMTMVDDMHAQQDKERNKLAEARVLGTSPSLELDQYEGQYESELYGKATVSQQDGLLQLQLARHPTISGKLEHWHYDTFMCYWSDVIFDKSLVPFVLDGQGKVAEFRLKVRVDYLDPLEYTFRRL